MPRASGGAPCARNARRSSGLSGRWCRLAVRRTALVVVPAVGLNPMAVLPNIASVEIGPGDIELATFHPYDRDEHKRLERAHAGTHVFRRRGNSLEAVAVSLDAPRLDATYQVRSAMKLGGLVDMLIERGLERQLGGSASPIAFARRRPLTFVSLDPKNDLVLTLFPATVSAKSRLHVRRGFKVEARKLLLKDGDSTRTARGLIIDAYASPQLEGTCADLIADGLDVRGLYVRELGDPDAPFWAERKTLGVVDRIAGDRVVLGADRRDEQCEFLASAVTLDLTPAAVVRISTHYLGYDAHERLWEERGHIASGAKRWERLSGLRARLAKVPVDLAQGVTASVGDWIDARRFDVRKLSLPQYAVASNKVVASPKDMLRAGPYYVPSSIANAPTATCVIHEAGRKSEVEKFLRSLREGQGAHRAIAGTYRMRGLDFTLFGASVATSSAYEAACRDAIDSGTKWKLALVQVPSDTKGLHGDENPYLITKAKFLSRGIPVQEFRPETMNKGAEQLQWALGGIALQMFAKLGGVPWLLRAPQQATHEIVLGLGSGHLGTGRFGERERLVGLTTAFSGDGRYWLTEASKAVPYDEHEQAVGEAAAAAVAQVRRQMAWVKGDKVRLVFHSFKDFSGEHVQKLLGAVESLREEGFEVEFSFVHIAENHPILLFDTTQKDRIAARGIGIKVGDHEAVVSAMGPHDVRNARVGFPRPILLRIHKDSTFKNLSYLCEQVLAFAGHSWRNFGPTSLPVTMLYADLIVGLLGDLGNLSRWDPDILRGPVATSQWFL